MRKFIILNDGHILESRNYEKIKILLLTLTI